MEKHVRYKYKNKNVKEQRFGDDQRWVISCSRFRKRKTQNQERYLRCAPEGLSFLHHFLNFHLFLPLLLFSDRYFRAHSRSRLSLFGTVNSQNGDFSKKMKYSNTVVDSPTRPTDFLLHVMSISADAPSNLTYWDYLSQTHRAPSLNSARKNWLTSILCVKPLSHCDHHLFTSLQPRRPLKAEGVPLSLPPFLQAFSQNIDI